MCEGLISYHVKHAYIYLGTNKILWRVHVQKLATNKHSSINHVTITSSIDRRQSYKYSGQNVYKTLWLGWL